MIPIHTLIFFACMLSQPPRYLDRCLVQLTNCYANRRHIALTREKIVWQCAKDFE
jgi:hypothetical protein